MIKSTSCEFFYILYPNNLCICIFCLAPEFHCYLVLAILKWSILVLYSTSILILCPSVSKYSTSTGRLKHTRNDPVTFQAVSSDDSYQIQHRFFIFSLCFWPHSYMTWQLNSFWVNFWILKFIYSKLYVAWEYIQWFIQYFSLIFFVCRGWETKQEYIYFKCTIYAWKSYMYFFKSIWLKFQIASIY